MTPKTFKTMRKADAQNFAFVGVCVGDNSEVVRHPKVGGFAHLAKLLGTFGGQKCLSVPAGPLEVAREGEVGDR